jgi:hypothetical protein
MTATLPANWLACKDTGITVNCEGTGTGTHADCHGWVNPLPEYRRCTCPCHTDGSNPPWGYWAEHDRIVSR